MKVAVSNKMFHCRVCLTFKDNLYPIKEYLTAFEQVTGIVSEDTALLCPSCIRRLCNSYEFLLEALKSEEVLKLKKAVLQVEIKEELLSEDEVQEVILQKPENVTAVEPVSKNIIEEVKVYETIQVENNEDDTIIDMRTVNSKRAKDSWTKDAKHNIIRNCPYCFYYDRAKLKMMEHIQEHINQNGGLECDHCGVKFSRKKYLKEHLIRAVHSTRCITCKICQGKFPNRITLDEHVAKEHSNQHTTYLCPKCGEVFQTRYRLKQHIDRNHENFGMEVRAYSCTYCEKRFKTKRCWQYHEMIHTNERPFICDTCGYGFKTKDALRDHEPIHTGELKFTCEVCHKGFRSRQLLTGHKVLHTNVFRHKCDICGMQFRRTSNLNEHKLCHTDKRDFVCMLCTASFKSRGSLKRHMKQHTLKFGIDDKSFKLTRVMTTEGIQVQGTIPNYETLVIEKV